MMKKWIALLLCMVLTMSMAVAEEHFEAPELSEEELEQWAEWAEGDGEESDATAENAAELTPEEEAMLDEHHGYRGGSEQSGAE